jgi:hypothetical protein
MKPTLSDGKRYVHGLGVLMLYLCSSCTKCTSSDARDTSAKGTATDVTSAPHRKRNRVTADCKALEASAEFNTASACHCVSDGDCCLIWDMEDFDCASASRSEDLGGLRDSLRAQVRNCGRKVRDCGDFEPMCRKGRCELRGARTAYLSDDSEILLHGFRYECRQPYTPAVAMLGLNSPGVALLTDPRLDPWFGIDLPDGGGYGAQAHVEVCVSEEGAVTSARTRMHLPEFPSTILEDKILETWQFKPLVVDGSARPFCVQIAYPMVSRN